MIRRYSPAGRASLCAPSQRECGAMVEESDSGARKDRSEVGVDFVEEPGIQHVLDAGLVDEDPLDG